MKNRYQYREELQPGRIHHSELLRIIRKGKATVIEYNQWGYYTQALSELMIVGIILVSKFKYIPNLVGNEMLLPSAQATFEHFN